MCVMWIDLFHVVRNVAALGFELLKSGQGWIHFQIENS